MPNLITIQTHLDGIWHDAALLDVKAPERGISSPCTLDYDLDYFVEFASVEMADGLEVRDRRAVSIGVPVDMEFRSFRRWPAFLLDLLPQGHARRRMAKQIGFDDPDVPAVEFPLLLEGAGCPVGNLRIREAWERERVRVAEETAKSGPCRGISLDDILQRTDAFLWVAERFALVASGSSGVQGEWPKILMTCAADGLWYPDSIVPDVDARRHVIVKLSRARHREDSVILASEAPYLEVAREFGLRVGAPLASAPHVLVIPRFDRAVERGGVVRFGQESLVSALGVADFGYAGSHEGYISVIAGTADDPAAEITEYVLRDLLNHAMGNPDNHGRNTAFRKLADGTVRLTPLFDFAPMRLDPGGIVRSTRWACMGGSDARPDWSRICEEAARGVMPAADLAAALCSRESFLRDLPGIARRHGVPDEAVEQACRNHGTMADGIAALRGRRHGL